ncbi:MAG: recombinase family protein [Citrobacter amalonaticus]|jgi:DNA invertase Pin-like site-specific DNA recombinase|nr:recombinase family protein [Citrobacter amalonaticus]
MELSLSDFNEKVLFAAEYMRMSTDHQQYSIDNQAGFIREYAIKHGINIIHSYSDEGKSGLNLSGRPGLKKLIDDVMSKRIIISCILVYDVSRFGRFQDTDEAAYYAYLLKKNGVRIIYCAEHFSEEHPEMFTFGLALSRHGAASFSRNQSEKVFLGQVNLIRKGYHQGGAPGYGLRRLLIDEHHKEKGILLSGQRKSIQTDRVILTPGPEHEIAIVNQIFDMFIHEGKPELVIASELNRNNIVAGNNTEWTRGKVHQILTNEKYIGNSVYNKTSFKLKREYVRNPESEWIRFDGAYKAIVSKDKFDRAREIINSRSVFISEDELLEKLHSLLLKKGRLSGVIIDEEEMLPSSSIYRARFGSLLRVYSLIGYNPKTDYSWMDTEKYLKGFNSEITKTVIHNIYLSDGWVSDSSESGFLKVNDEFTLSLQSVRCQRTSPTSLRWRIRFSHIVSPDISIAVRMDSLNKSMVDYYIFPSVDLLCRNLLLKEQNNLCFELYRFDTLQPLYQLIKRMSIPEKK